MKRSAHDAGFTLLEMIVTLMIIALVASITLPRMASDTTVRLSGTARLIRSDLELAQVMTISHPDRPVVVTFDVNAGAYWLADQDTPDTPMLHPETGDPYLVELGVGRAAVALETTLQVADIPGGVLRFNAQGGLVDFSLNPVITLLREDFWVQLTIAPTTGLITETEGQGTPP